MRIGLIGPVVDGDREALEEAIDFLLGDAEAEQVVYLGEDEAVGRFLERAERDGDSEPSEFLARAHALAVDGTASAIDAFLDRDRRLPLDRLRTLPDAPARAVEIIGDRIVLLVHDKRILDEEDIANAHVIVFGRADELMLKRFGARYFFTPGPLAGGKVGLLEADEEGRIAVSVYAPSGEPVWREVLQSKRAKMSVVG